MKTRIRLTILAALLLTLLACQEVVSASSFHLVRWVDDGDTVVLSHGRRVRYTGINAPEVAHEDRPAERFGPEARDFNRKLVFGKKVRLEFDREKRDQYGRVLAYLFLQDGTFVNAELVKGGHAHCLFRRPNIRYDSLFLRLQREAMAKRVGMWKRFPDQRGPYLGNRYSRRFHQMTCPFGKATAAKHRIAFKTKHAAFWAGYSPCKRCNP
ncbi:MAG TPA: nuclease (SNase domain-containing protein) [Desulfobacterales bacterium]|jgi:endonuclease YncB( thermonuclease family)|nr:nuclease (SNase domain-containing protein) [Desulfobacterales bacterium]